MNRDVGKGPFATKATADKDGPAGSVIVTDSSGEVFCYVDSDYCAGDFTAAKARATRIAEALNQREGHAEPAPYIDEGGNLRAPPGFCFVAAGQGVQMVPVLGVIVERR